MNTTAGKFFPNIESGLYSLVKRMPFSNDDKIVIKHYVLDKNYGRKKLLAEFPGRGWTDGGLKYLVKKIRETGSVERKIGRLGSVFIE